MTSARRRLRSILLAASAVCVAAAQPALAGMPAPFTLTDLARMRVQTISFFAIVLFASALAVKWLWNALRRDFPRLPHLGYGRSLGVVALWGLLFVLVLTMISGARELLTPGAWERKGATYQLVASAGSEDFEAQRWSRMAELKAALWAYAAAHSGQLPPTADVKEISPDAWRTPDPSRIRYVYLPGQQVDRGSAVVAFEPPAFPPPRLVLTSDGAIKPYGNQELQAALGGSKKP